MDTTEIEKLNEEWKVKISEIRRAHNQDIVKLLEKYKKIGGITDTISRRDYQQQTPELVRVAWGFSRTEYDQQRDYRKDVLIARLDGEKNV